MILNFKEPWCILRKNKKRKKLSSLFFRFRIYSVWGYLATVNRPFPPPWSSWARSPVALRCLARRTSAASSAPACPLWPCGCAVLPQTAAPASLASPRASCGAPQLAGFAWRAVTSSLTVVQSGCAADQSHSRPIACRCSSVTSPTPAPTSISRLTNSGRATYSPGPRWRRWRRRRLPDGSCSFWRLQAAVGPSPSTCNSPPTERTFADALDCALRRKTVRPRLLSSELRSPQLLAMNSFASFVFPSSAAIRLFVFNFALSAFAKDRKLVDS